MCRRLIAPLAAALLTLPLVAAPAAAELTIHVNKSTQHMTVSQDGHFLYRWPVSTGREGMNTPSGTFRPFRMSLHHVSHEYDDAPMPHAIFFTRTGDAIHGTDEQRWIGNAVSHGCVRLSLRHAAILWKLVKQEKMANTRVVLTGHVPQGAPLVAHNSRDQDQGYVQDPYGEDVATAAPRYQQRWTNGDAYYEDNDRAYYDDNRPPPPPANIPPRRYRADNRYGPPPSAPFPFFLFGR